MSGLSRNFKEASGIFNEGQEDEASIDRNK
jgi:hypothetical protein